MGSAVGITDDHAEGLYDRLRSLPIPRSAVLAGRALADTVTQVWGLIAMTIVSFLVGFRLDDGIGNGLIAVGLIVVYLFAFEWVFITTGLYAGNAQAAQGLSLILVPFTFVSSAYVPVSSMPSGLRAIAEHQPVTYMVDAVRTLAGGGACRGAARSPGELFHRPLADLVGGDRAGVRSDRDRAVPARLTATRSSSAASGHVRRRPRAPAFSRFARWCGADEMMERAQASDGPGSSGSHCLMTTVKARACRPIVPDGATNTQGRRVHLLAWMDHTTRAVLA
jgi:hypothetical protein